MPRVARQEHPFSVVVGCQRRFVGIDKSFQIRGIVRLYPTRRVQRRRFENHGNFVFRANSVRQNVELQTADNADNPIRADLRFEHARPAFLGDFL